jgi:hypothetical protein
MDLGLNQVNIAESFTQLLKTCSTCRNYKWKIELYHKIKRKFEWIDESRFENPNWRFTRAIATTQSMQPTLLY